jgi:peptidoglycan/LPS O-acetylase OafA/YrhL
LGNTLQTNRATSPTDPATILTSSNNPADRALTLASLSQPKYRPDIDGLRAIAILSVIIFHAFPDKLKGGFIGVDIFFVISGYLISSIIFENIDRSSFRFAQFYGRRIKRIFPALTLVLLSCLVFGWFGLLGDEYKQLGKHAAAGAGFVSNFFFWQEIGYFNNAAETKPLLHLWSLAIEEQFYIFWPLLVWLTWKRKTLFLILFVSLLLGSLAYNVYLARLDPTATFYSPATRIWELLVGVLLAYINTQPRAGTANPWNFSGSMRQTASALGVMLLAIAFFKIDKDRPFPGTWAILPVLGSFLLIFAGPTAWFNRFVLSNRLLVWTGLISFPLYLWHWPILTFMRIEARGTPDSKYRLLALSILLAWLTYHFIEKPIRNDLKNRLKIITLSILITVLGGAGYQIFSNFGYPARSVYGKDKQAFYDYFQGGPPDWGYQIRTNAIEKSNDKCSFYDLRALMEGKETNFPRIAIAESCFHRNSRQKSVMLWGNSYAMHLYAGLEKAMPKDWQILQVASLGCKPTLENARPSQIQFCEQSNWFALKTIEEARPDVVIIAQDIDQSSVTYNALTQKILSLGVKKIIIAGALPQWEAELHKIVIADFWDAIPRRTFHGVHTQTMIDDRKFRSELILNKNIVFADFMNTFCNKDGCLVYLGADVKLGLVTWDGGHLTEIASEYLAENYLVKLILEKVNPD